MEKLMKRREPYEFMLWTGIVGMTITFLALTAIYVLRKGGSDWENFYLPKVFGMSTFFMLASSFTLQQANQALAKDEFFAFRYLLGTTLVLGLLFMGSQYWGWVMMQEKGFFVENGKVSGSFLYLISGLHVLHLLGGMLALLYVFLQNLRKTRYVDAFIYSVNPPNRLRLRLITIYWHFVDVLWLYLYFFFSYHYH